VIGQLHVPAALTPEKEPRYPLIMRLVKPWNPSEGLGKEKNLLPLGEFKKMYRSF